VPLKLTTFSYFRNCFLNKIITEIGKIKLNNFFPSLEGAKEHGKTGWGAMAGLAPLDPPLDLVVHKNGFGPSIQDVHMEAEGSGSDGRLRTGEGSAPRGCPHRKLEPTDIVLSSSHA